MFVRGLEVLDNGYLASGSGDKTIKIWNPYNGTLIQTLTGHNASIWSLQNIKNGRLASSSEDATIKIC